MKLLGNFLRMDTIEHFRCFIDLSSNLLQLGAKKRGVVHRKIYFRFKCFIVSICEQIQSSVKNPDNVGALVEPYGTIALRSGEKHHVSVCYSGRHLAVLLDVDCESTKASKIKGRAFPVVPICVPYLSGKIDYRGYCDHNSRPPSKRRNPFPVAVLLIGSAREASHCRSLQHGVDKKNSNYAECSKPTCPKP
ncbi:hypothetical protein AGRA671_09960 [Agrobacterium radiobacter]|nr:Uncharacterised protein [Agrobacterium tumefaciens]